MTNPLPNLGYFSGTEHWYKFNPLFPNILLTDGAKYVADEAGAYWLMDIIGSVQHKLKGEDFQVWELTKVPPSMAVVVCEDGNDNELYRQEIEYTDFPLETIKLYACFDGQRLTIMLPGEY